MLQSQGLLRRATRWRRRQASCPRSSAPPGGRGHRVGNCVSACDKNTTTITRIPHHPRAVQRHGRTVTIGVVITNENVTLKIERRQLHREARQDASRRRRSLEEGFGNPDADLIMNCTKLERQNPHGADTTVYRRDRASQSLADPIPWRAVVSAGSTNG